MKQFSKDLGNVSLAPKGRWSKEQEYERLNLVYNACDNLSYVAKIDVPIGVEIDNREYWQPMNATGYADNNFINLTTESENGTVTAYESLEEAVATILPINRRPGATLSFFNLNADRLDRQAEFELWQFNSTDLANWEIRDYWNNIYYNWNVFAGWYVGADGLKNHVKIPNVGQYAYVGTNLNDALLYQCRTNGTWTNTGIKVRNYISVVVSGNITIGENGNWFSDGKDTGIPATPAVDEQLDNIIMQLQQHTTEINNLKKSDANLQDQITSNDNDITNLTAKHESLSRTVQGIAATGGASTANNVTYNNDSSGLNAENAQDAIDELQGSKIDKISILQESGKAEDKVMSQKAVSDKLSDLDNVDKKLNAIIESVREDVDDIVKSKNLLNKQDVNVLINYRQYDEIPREDNNSVLSGYIRVIPGKKYIYSSSLVNYPGISYIAEFDADKVYLRNNNASQLYQASDDAVYIRITITKTAWLNGNLQLEKGNNATAFTPYSKNISEDLVDTTSIKDNAVTPEKTSFYSEIAESLDLIKEVAKTVNYVYGSKNLISLLDEDVMENYRQYSDTPEYNDNYCLSGYIPTIPEETYTYKNFSNRTNHLGIPYIVSFDKNKNFIRKISSSNTFTLQKNEVYIRITLNKIVWKNDKIQLELGNTSTEYEPYCKKIIDDSVETSSLKDGSVTPIKTSFLYSKNLFNESDPDVLLGHRQVGSSPESNTNYNLSGYIAVEEGKTYIFSTNTSAYKAMTYITLYDKNKEYIKFLANVTSYTTEKGVAFVRLNINIRYWKSNIQFEEGTVATNYKSYGLEIKNAAYDVFPSIVLPSRTYILSEYENSVYHKNYLDIWNPYKVLVTSGHSNNSSYPWKYRERCFRTKGSTYKLDIKLYDIKTLNQIAYAESESLTGDSAKNNGQKNIICIGDSFTYDGRWVKQIADVCPNVNLIGMRDPAQNAAQGVKCEGRGGWTLAEYFNPYSNVTLAHMQPFSPFMHSDGYVYYGPIDFWKVVVNGNSQYPYGTNGFSDYKNWFNSNGYKSNPQVNDLMYNGTSGKYEYWNGSAWIALTTAPTFKFDFSKYISTWNIQTPDVILILLGKNDFHEGVSNWEDFYNKMNIVIQSIHNYNSSVKIGICTPTTADVAANNSDNINQILGHMNMWNARKLLIQAYDTDNMRSNNVYLVDTGVVLDPDYGFPFNEEKPFEYYEGSEKELYDYNGVHPSAAGYKQIGTCAAAFVQYIR